MEVPPSPVEIARRVHVVDVLPKTATGKIQKYILRTGAPAIARQ
jgi:acyl-coenzyme A synthetase/AMP-(fatty) acid ligase